MIDQLTTRVFSAPAELVVKCCVKAGIKGT